MKKYELGLIATGTATVIIIFWLLTWYLGHNLEFNNRGTFGDMFGSINALYSGLALAGIIMAILLQRADLKLTRKELEDTKEEFKKQNETLRFQRFETTLFNLINLHEEIIERLDYIDNKQKLNKGRGVFRSINENLKNEIKPNFFNKSDDLDHYFRNIYRIVKFIYYEGFTDKKKYEYAKILRSQLSSHQLICLYYWCQEKKGEKIIKYINEFTFFKNIPQSFKDDPINLKIFKDQAFEVKEEYRNL